MGLTCFYASIPVFVLALGCGPVVDSEGDSVGDAAGVDSEDDSGGATSGRGPGPSTSGGPDDREESYEGSYLLAVSASLSPSTPLQYRTQVQVEGGSIQLEMQPLTLDVGSTTMPREAHGEPILPPAIALGPDRSVAFELRDLFVAAPTNPITGSDVVATIAFEGAFVDRGLLCGTIRGEITSPLVADLDGSTFAAVALQGDELPSEFPWSCP